MVVILFIVYALIGRWIPGMFQSRPVTLGQIFYYLAWDSTAMLGLPLNIVATVVGAWPLFMVLLGLLRRRIYPREPARLRRNQRSKDSFRHEDTKNTKGPPPPSSPLLIDGKKRLGFCVVRVNKVT
ncbi:MAG: hypothetical protein HYY82_20515 [Deltaproteobacteria bacterium]|nr:hypothetical protein [Deltaproteobacteria bacterium]